MDGLLEILTGMHPEVDFESRDDLIDGKVLDSFDIITIVAEVDDKLGISIPPEEIVPENFNSYKALCKLLERLEDE